MQRIATRGPQFGDVVVEHAEKGDPMADDVGVLHPVAKAYSYIPFTVLGDYQFEPEPNWLELSPMNVELFWEGLRQRNWTSDSYRWGAVAAAVLQLCA